MKIFRRKDDEAVSPVIAIILMVAITVVLASVLYVWVMNLAETEDTVAKFPKVEVDVDHTSSVDRILIKHIDGDPLDWTKYKIIITNASDSADQATMTTLAGEMTAGQTTTFENTTYSDMNDVKFKVGGGYDIEIYNLKENKRELLAENVICTAA